MSMDDDFGGFEEAPISVNTNIQQNTIEASFNSKSNLPDWLLDSPKSVPKYQNQGKLQDFNNNSNVNSNVVKELQEELAKTKEQLIDQQTSYLQLQTQQRQEHNSFNQIYKDFQNLMNQALSNQRETLIKEFKTFQTDQERKIMQQVKDINSRFETTMNEKFENKLAEFQESLIKHYESEFEDLEVKIKRIIDSVLKDERTNEKQKFEKIENELKSTSEKYIQNYFRNQSETFKEQIKSGVLQEHLIHRDLINNKLEKLFKSSEEKRRKTNLLFARHMSGLNFFVDNAHKQLGILKEAQQDLLKNKEIIDYYGDETKSTTSDGKPNSLSSLSSLSISTLGLGQMSKDNLFDLDDENLIDENLI